MGYTSIRMKRLVLLTLAAHLALLTLAVWFRLTRYDAYLTKVLQTPELYGADLVADALDAQFPEPPADPGPMLERIEKIVSHRSLMDGLRADHPLRTRCAELIEETARRELKDKEQEALLEIVCERGPRDRMLFSVLPKDRRAALATGYVAEFVRKLRGEAREGFRTRVSYAELRREVASAPITPAGGRDGIRYFLRAADHGADGRRTSFYERLLAQTPAEELKDIFLALLAAAGDPPKPAGIPREFLQFESLAPHLQGLVMATPENRLETIAFFFGTSPEAALIDAAKQHLTKEEADLFVTAVVQAHLDRKWMELRTEALVGRLLDLTQGRLPAKLYAYLLGLTEAAKHRSTLAWAGVREKSLRPVLLQHFDGAAKHEQQQLISALAGRKEAPDAEEAGALETLGLRVLGIRNVEGSTARTAMLWLDLTQPKTRAAVRTFMLDRPHDDFEVSEKAFRKTDAESMSELSRDVVVALAGRRNETHGTRRFARHLPRIATEEHAVAVIEAALRQDELWSALREFLLPRDTKADVQLWAGAAASLQARRPSDKLLWMRTLGASADALADELLKQIEDPATDARRRAELCNSAAADLAPKISSPLKRLRLIRYASNDRRSAVSFTVKDWNTLAEELVGASSEDLEVGMEALIGTRSALDAVTDDRLANLLGSKLPAAEFETLFAAVVQNVQWTLPLMDAIAKARGLKVDGFTLLRQQFLARAKTPAETLARLEAAFGPSGAGGYRARNLKPGDLDRLLALLLEELRGLVKKLPKEPKQAYRVQSLHAFLARGGCSPKSCDELVRTYRAVPEEHDLLRADLYVAVARIGNERVTTFLITHLPAHQGALKKLGYDRVDGETRLRLRHLTGIDLYLRPASEVEEWLKKNKARLRDQIE